MNRTEFEQIVPRLRPLMVKVGRDFFGDRDEAEDVAQDALVRLWNYCERLDANRNVEQLAIMVAKNVCVEKYKRRRMSHGRPPETIAAGKADQPDAAMLGRETIDRLDAAIRRLQPREQQLVRQRYVDDCSTEEIARDTGIPHPSIRSMLSTAKSKLIKILKQDETAHNT
ncbi:MAG: sigma-70 family RNA polymerase sigma factor [Bacteroidaceae bacterium]|nr:sigma-70 family RNA polymerase sigma factor [Bacteroidaceae bacterium]